MIQGSHDGWRGGRWSWDPIRVNRASRAPWEACAGKVDMVAARTKLSDLRGPWLESQCYRSL